MKLWILGAGGQLGRALIDQCQLVGIRCIAASRREVDVTDFEALKRQAASVQCTHVVNCAAYTDVDGAEKWERKAYRVNSMGAENVAWVGRECGMRVIHVSTDYIFDGEKGAPYVETDSPRPINVYGKSKWEGEQRVLDHFPTACIVRASWIFGRGGKNFISSIAEKLQNQPHIDANDDQVSRLTYNRDLARALIDLACHTGIFHFANGEEGTRYKILQDFFNAMRQRDAMIRCQAIRPISSTVFPDCAARPPYSVLSTGKVAKVLGRKPRTWETILNEYLDQICPFA